MKAIRNTAFLAMFLVWLSSPRQAQALTAGGNPDCNAWTCHDAFCPIDEESCDDLCASFNSEQSPMYRVECADYVYSQGGPTACYDDFPGVCGGLYPGLLTCDCAPDEAIPPRGGR